MPMPHAIVVSLSSDVSIFSRKHSERPNQLLIRIQEYVERIHG